MKTVSFIGFTGVVALQWGGVTRRFCYSLAPMEALVLNDITWEVSLTGAAM